MSGAMRLAQSSILVLSLSVFVCIGSVVGARKMLFLAHDGARDNNSSLTTALKTTGGNRCKSKKKVYCCECFFSSSEKMINNDTSSEEKRVVPTGPNPLHNK